MAGQISWPIDAAFKAMVDKAVKAKQKILLVKDHGVYLMTNAKPKNLVVYARGFNPEVDDFDSWYDRAHRVLGGDDFGEQLEPDFFAKAVAAGAKSIKFKFTATRMTAEFVR